MLEDPEDTCILQPSSTMISTLSPSVGQMHALVKVEDDSYQDDLLQDSLAIDDPKFDSRLQSCKDSNKFATFPEESHLCNKDILNDLTSLKNHHQKTLKSKETFRLKSK